MEDINSEERQILCSRCFQVTPESSIRVIPCFNGDLGEYVASYRCEQCWQPSLEETRGRITSTEDMAEIKSLAIFFERHHVFLHEFRRGDPIAVVRTLLVRMLGLVESGAIKLSVVPAP
jgi:hypothetical protein